MRNTSLRVVVSIHWSSLYTVEANSPNHDFFAFNLCRFTNPAAQLMTTDAGDVSNKVRSGIASCNQRKLQLMNDPQEAMSI